MSDLRVALMDPIPDVLGRGLRIAVESAGFEFVPLDTLDLAARRAALAECDYGISFRRPLEGGDLPENGRLRLVQRWGAGFDGIDLDGLRGRDVGLLCTAGANAGYVAEMALTLMLAARREAVKADRALRQGRWEGERHYASSSSLLGKTVGLIGFGMIARHLAHLLRPFDCTLLYVARREMREIDVEFPEARRVTLDELLSASDVVSVHVPLNGETRGMLGPREFGLMKPSAILVNTARGQVIDEAALFEALRTGTIAAAGIDVFSKEPIAPDHPLLALDNVVLTPHLGGKVRENVEGVIRHIVRNLSAHAAGKALSPADIVVPPKAPVAS